MVDEVGELPNFKEMKQAINRMGRQKSPGITSSIPAELF
jgi:hypothetical protein